MDQPQKPAEQHTTQPVPVPAPVAAAENPGEAMGVAGVVLTYIGIGIAGIILGVLSRNKSRQANMSTTLGTLSLVLGIVSTVFGFIALLATILLFVIAAASAV